MKDYILNDKGSLKKKMKHESRKEAFTSGTEAKYGSNMVILMKTTFFEHLKAEFIHDLSHMECIGSIENPLGSKADTDDSGEAFVEYSLDIVFKAHDISHVVKMTAYTTTCKIMFQPVGEPTVLKSHLGDKCIPRYFLETFFIPWCEEAYSNKKYNEKEIMEAIRTEIRRLDPQNWSPNSDPD